MIKLRSEISKFTVIMLVKVSTAEQTIGWFCSGKRSNGIIKQTTTIDYLIPGQDCVAAVLPKGDSLISTAIIG